MFLMPDLVLKSAKRGGDLIIRDGMVKL